MENALVDPPTAAARIGSNARTLKAMRKRLQGPPWIRVGRRVKYRITDLDAYLEASTVRPPPTQPRTSLAATILGATP